MAASDAAGGIFPSDAAAKAFRKSLSDEVLDGRFWRSYLGFRRAGQAIRPISAASESFFKKFSRKAVDGR
jgi:hypothetical protein